MSALLQPVNDSRRLKGRAAYFFTTKARSRDEVAGFAETLLELGSVVAIGGFLRDLLLAGNRRFRSDVDFVVDPVSIREFERFAERLGAKANRFGGYGITLEKWKVDVWPLERTWAAVNGHVPVSVLDDLVNVTFFDWDAVLYSVAKQRLIAKPTYFERVRERILDINLEPNPNPLGNAVRALRYAYRWEAAIGTRLASHVSRQIRDHGWEKLVESERCSFGNPVLSSLDGDAIHTLLQGCVQAGSQFANLPITPLQHSLPLACPTYDAETRAESRRQPARRTRIA